MHSRVHSRHSNNYDGVRVGDADGGGNPDSDADVLSETNCDDDQGGAADGDEGDDDGGGGVDTSRRHVRIPLRSRLYPSRPYVIEVTSYPL